MDGQKTTLSPEQQKAILAHPVEFSRAILGYDLYPWQEECLNECEWILANPEKRPNAISLLACNGSGKTSVFVTSLVLWAMSAYIRCNHKGASIPVSEMREYLSRADTGIEKQQANIGER